MADDEDIGPVFFSPPNRVKLSPFTTPTPLNRRRLSTHLAKPNNPVVENKPGLAWISLQGRLIGAEEATSARVIGGGLNRDEAVGWELFSPIHRVLIVAVVAVAVVKSEKNREIVKLKNSVQFRDQILMSMQQKLDDLCEQVNCVKDQHPPAVSDLSLSDSICTDCWLCDQHRAQFNDISGNALMKVASSDEMFRSRGSISNEAEQEERRMSDLSDWASSVTSAADIQLSNLAVEQDIYNLKRECEDKNVALKELSASIHSKDTATSKRIQELEDIIRRKSMIITRLKKDMLVLEQKVVNQARAKRRSFSGRSTEKKQVPVMTDNLIYDMDSPTSPLSSDSDCSSKKPNLNTSSVVKQDKVDTYSLYKQVHSKLNNESTSRKNHNSTPATAKRIISSSSSVQISKSRSVSPLKEKSMNQTHHSTASVGSRNNRKRVQSAVSKDIASHKRWV